MRTWFWSLLILACLAGLSFAGPPFFQVDQAEVIRRGDQVEHVAHRYASEERDALAPPASDADKWFISVLTMQGCAACEKLKRDWGASEWLLALGHPTDAKQSWAHYNVYRREDQSQAWRFEKIKVESYPTILVQPPRTGRYGDPATIVFQGPYGGDPQQLAQRITRAIRLYVSKLPPRPVQGAINDCTPDGCDLPWRPNPAPKDDPVLPLLRPDRRPLHIPPDELFDRPLSRLVGRLLEPFVSALISLMLVAAGIGGVFYYLRSRRSATDQNAAILQALAELRGNKATPVEPPAVTPAEVPSPAPSAAAASPDPAADPQTQLVVSLAELMVKKSRADLDPQAQLAISLAELLSKKSEEPAAK